MLQRLVEAHNLISTQQVDPKWLGGDFQRLEFCTRNALRQPCIFCLMRLPSQLQLLPDAVVKSLARGQEQMLMMPAVSSQVHRQPADDIMRMDYWPDPGSPADLPPPPVAASDVLGGLVPTYLRRGLAEQAENAKGASLYEPQVFAAHGAHTHLVCPCRWCQSWPLSLLSIYPSVILQPSKRAGASLSRAAQYLMRLWHASCSELSVLLKNVARQSQTE